MQAPRDYQGAAVVAVVTDWFTVIRVRPAVAGVRSPALHPPRRFQVRHPSGAAARRVTHPPKLPCRHVSKDSEPDTATAHGSTVLAVDLKHERRTDRRTMPKCARLRSRRCLPSRPRAPTVRAPTDTAGATHPCRTPLLMQFRARMTDTSPGLRRLRASLRESRSGPLSLSAMYDSLPACTGDYGPRPRLPNAQHSSRRDPLELGYAPAETSRSLLSSSLFQQSGDAHPSPPPSQHA